MRSLCPFGVPVVPLLVALVALVAAPAADVRADGEATVRHVDGEPSTGTVQRATADRLVLDTAEGETGLDLRNVETIEYANRPPVAPAVGPHPLRIELSSGDVLIGRVVAGFGEDGFLFRSAAFGVLPLQVEWVTRIDSRVTQQRRPFEPDAGRLANGKDVLWLVPTGNAPGDAAFGDPRANGLIELHPDHVVFHDDADVFDDIPWAAVHAITRPVERVPQPEEFSATVISVTGERFTGRVLRLATGEWKLRSRVLDAKRLLAGPDLPPAVAGTHACGVTATVAQRHVQRLTFAHGHFRWLSDDQPVLVREYPWLGGAGAVRPGGDAPDGDGYWWRYRRDRAVTGDPLRLLDENGVVVRYRRGLGVHSYSLLSFRLDGTWTTFSADIGLDPSAQTETGPGGSVVFEVLADDEPAPRYSSPVIRGGDARRYIEVDVRGVRFLHLRVRFADRADIRDRASWCRALLQRGD